MRRPSAQTPCRPGRPHCRRHLLLPLLQRSVRLPPPPPKPRTLPSAPARTWGSATGSPACASAERASCFFGAACEYLNNPGDRARKCCMSMAQVAAAALVNGVSYGSDLNNPATWDEGPRAGLPVLRGVRRLRLLTATLSRGRRPHLLRSPRETRETLFGGRDLHAMSGNEVKFELSKQYIMLDQTRRTIYILIAHTFEGSLELCRAKDIKC